MLGRRIVENTHPGGSEGVLGTGRRSTIYVHGSYTTALGRELPCQDLTAVGEVQHQDPCVHAYACFIRDLTLSARIWAMRSSSPMGSQ